MARKGISFEQVQDAANRIKARGDRVNSRTVRAELGTGSITTILAHLAEIEGSKNRKTSNAVDATLELPERIVQAILDELEAGKAGVREEMQAELDETKADRDALAQQLDSVSEALDEAEQAAAKTGGQMLELSKQLEATRKLQELAEGERNAYSTKMREMEMRLDVAEKAATELPKVRAQLAQEQEKRHKAELDAKQAANTLAGQEAKCADLNDEVKELQEALDHARRAMMEYKEALGIEKATTKTLQSWEKKAGELQARLEEETKLRHAAELEASKQAGLAQRMQDLAVEAKAALADTKPARTKRSNVKKTTETKQ